MINEFYLCSTQNLKLMTNGTFRRKFKSMCTTKLTIYDILKTYEVQLL